MSRYWNKQLLLVRGNKLLLRSFLEFNGSKHILLNIPIKIWILWAKKTKVTTSIEWDKNGGFHNVLGYLLPDEFHSDRLFIIHLYNSLQGFRRGFDQSIS